MKVESEKARKLGAGLRPDHKMVGQRTWAVFREQSDSSWRVSQAELSCSSQGTGVQEGVSGCRAARKCLMPLRSVGCLPRLNGCFRPEFRAVKSWVWPEEKKEELTSLLVFTLPDCLFLAESAWI